MKISINTETEEIEELRHTIAILEDAIKRRETPDLYDEDDLDEESEDLSEKKQEETKQLEQKPAQQIQQPQLPQLQQLQQLQPPQPTQPQQQQPQLRISQQQVPIQRPRERAPDVDMSALTMSDYGERKENRAMGGSRSTSSHSYSSSYTPQSSQSPQSYRPEPRTDSKSAVKNIIISLKNQRQGQAIQMSEIVTKARERSISESETRNLVSELQKEGAI